jgi:hypothetical protein
MKTAELLIEKFYAHLMDASFLKQQKFAFQQTVQAVFKT